MRLFPVAGVHPLLQRVQAHLLDGQVRGILRPIRIVEHGHGAEPMLSLWASPRTAAEQDQAQSEDAIADL